jgi:hypothetical protein
MLRHRVLHDVRLRRRQRRNDLVRPRHDLLLEDPLLELVLVDAEELGSEDEGLVVVIEEGVGARRLDLHVTEVEERGEKLEDLPLTLDSDADGREGLLGRSKLGSIVNAVDGERRRTALVEVEEVGGGTESEVLAFRGRGTGEELVEDVVVALGFGLVDETGTFEEVGADAGTDDGLRVVEENLRRGNW